MLRTFTLAELDAAASLLRAGGVLAYPTEAVYGLGCGPHDRAAFEQIFALKQRPATQGVLLIAADFAQVERYIDFARVPGRVLDEVRGSWPGPHTWIFPRSADEPDWALRARHLAARTYELVSFLHDVRKVTRVAARYADTVT